MEVGEDLRLALETLFICSLVAVLGLRAPPTQS